MNRNIIKYIAIITMIIDHIAAFFVPFSSPIYPLMRIIGRFTAPTICYFLVEGYKFTKSKKKYALRLFFMGIISQIPFALVQYNTILVADFNMILCLFICFIILCVQDNINNKHLKLIIIFTLIILSQKCDWGLLAPLFVLGFYKFKNNKNKQTICFSIILLTFVTYSVSYAIIHNFSIYGKILQLGMLLFIPVLYLYNGKSGKKNAFNKWFFYIIYPLHLFVIWIFKYYIF